MVCIILLQRNLFPPAPAYPIGPVPTLPTASNQPIREKE